MSKKKNKHKNQSAPGSRTTFNSKALNFIFSDAYRFPLALLQKGGKNQTRDFINYASKLIFVLFKNYLLYLHFFTRQREVERDAVASKVEVNPKCFQVLIHRLQQLKAENHNIVSISVDL